MNRTAVNMTSMSMILASALGLCVALPMSAQARPAAPGIGSEISKDLADARKEMRVELAQAREELQTENLQLDHSLRFADRGEQAASDRPKAEITPDGDFLIDGEPQLLDTDQRRQLLAYRGQVIGIALAGIDIGEQSADAALDMVDGSWVSLLFHAMTGSLEGRIERMVMEQVQPAVLAICKQLPALMESQHRLSSSLPAFQPYATLEPRDITQCEDEVRNEFAFQESP